MLEFLKRLFRRSAMPPGITMVDKHILECAELVHRCVTAQFEEAGVSLLSNKADYRPLMLGYVATLAEQLGRRLEKDDPQSTAILICLRAMEGLDGRPDQEALLQEFTEFSETRNHTFGQGGAIALEDFPGILNQVPPRGLYMELKRVHG